jgi:superfamily II DNA helicase RecQ
MISHVRLHVQVCRTEYKHLGKTLRASVGKVPIVALTATATAETVNSVQKCLNMQSPSVIRGPLFRPNLYCCILQEKEGLRRIVQASSNKVSRLAVGNFPQ